MSYRIGDEYSPVLRVDIRQDRARDVILVGVGQLPENHPLALALDVLVQRGATQDTVVAWSRFIVPWMDGVRRIVAVSAQLWKANPDPVQVILWYEEWQHVIQRPTMPARRGGDPMDAWLLRLRLLGFGVINPSSTQLLKGIIEA